MGGLHQLSQFLVPHSVRQLVRIVKNIILESHLFHGLQHLIKVLPNIQETDFFVVVFFHPEILLQPPEACSSLQVFFPVPTANKVVALEVRWWNEGPDSHLTRNLFLPLWGPEPCTPGELIPGIPVVLFTSALSS